MDTIPPPPSPGQGPFGVPPAGPPVRPGWVTAIGVISICYGGLGMFLRVVLLVFGLFAATTGARAGIPGLGEAPDWYRTYELIFNFILLLAGIPLVAGGIALLGCRPAARPLHLAWAVILLVSLPVPVIALLSLPSVQDLAGPEAVSAIFGASCVTLLRGGYPIFVLAWFLRGRIREQVASWAGAAPPWMR